MRKFTSYIQKRKNLLLYMTALTVSVLLLVGMLASTVFAQTTYVIIDGDEVKVYTTFATDPVHVLNQAGLPLGEDDTYTTQTGNGVSEITVQRNQLISIVNCGEEIEASSYGETLKQLLDRLGVETGGDYVVSLPLETETFDGMEVTVDRVVQMEQTYTVDIPYETTYCDDPTLPKGQEVVKVAGVTGQIRKTANVVYVNAEQTNHTVIKETVVQQPVNQIIAVGTGTQENKESNAPAIGDGVIVTADGEVLTYSKKAKFVATAYTKTDAGCNDITATGTTVRVGTVAVDPTVIPYGTRMFIVTNDGKYIYGIGTAEDCGGAIKGNRLDLYFDTDAECWIFGVRSCTVYFLD